MGDGGGRVVILHRGHEFGRLLAVPCVSQKFIHVDQSRARKDALVTDVPVPRLKEAQQFDLQLSLGSEIGVAALAGKNVMPAAIPEQPSFAEPGSRSNYRLIAGGPAHTVQWDQIRFRERSNSPSAGFEIVNEKSCRKMNLFGEPRLLYDPGKVRSLHPPVAHRARNSKTGSFRLRAGVIQETADDLAKFAVLAAGKHALRHQSQMSVLWLKISQPRIGTTNIAGQNHFSKFLQRRPSRSSNSSASFGPQVPEA